VLVMNYDPAEVIGVATVVALSQLTS